MEELIEKVENYINDANVVIYFRDNDNRYCYVNHAYEVLSGFTKEDLLGKTDYEVYPEEIADGFSLADKLVLGYNSIIIAYETFYDYIRSKWRRYVTVKLPLWDSDGKRFLVGVSVEVNSDFETIIETNNARLRALDLSRMSNIDTSPTNRPSYPMEIPPVGVFGSLDELRNQPPPAETLLDRRDGPE